MRSECAYCAGFLRGVVFEDRLPGRNRSWEYNEVPRSGRQQAAQRTCAARERTLITPRLFVCSGATVAAGAPGAKGRHLVKLDSVGSVADMRLGKMLDQAKNVGTPTQYLRNVNVRWFSFELVDLFEMRATQQDKGEFSIKDGDLLVCEGGEPGRCAVWNLGSNDLIFQKAIHRIRLKDKISPHW